MSAKVRVRSPSSIWMALKAYPTLLKIGFADAVAYRAEMLVWLLTTTMPLVSMALWSTAAQGQRLGPENFGSREFVAYFLLTLVVRLVTSNWVLWEISEDVRTGAFASRLLRPAHPLLVYTAEQIAALPLRAAIALPVAIGILLTMARDQLTHDLRLLGLFLLALPAAWLVNYLAMAAIGLLALWIDSALGLMYVWMGLFTLFSGYILPLSLLPAWLRQVADVLPFRYILDVPVKILLGWPIPGGDGRGQVLRDTTTGWHQALHAVGIAYLYIAALLVVLVLMWRRGLKRFGAFGS